MTLSGQAAKGQTWANWFASDRVLLGHRTGRRPPVLLPIISGREVYNRSIKAVYGRSLRVHGSMRSSSIWRGSGCGGTRTGGLGAAHLSTGDRKRFATQL